MLNKYIREITLVFIKFVVMKTILTLCITVFLVIGCNTSDIDKLNQKTSNINKKVDSVLALMTLQEKIGQMNQYNGFLECYRSCA